MSWMSAEVRRASRAILRRAGIKLSEVSSVEDLHRLAEAFAEVIRSGRYDRRAVLAAYKELRRKIRRRVVSGR